MNDYPLNPPNGGLLLPFLPYMGDLGGPDKTSEGVNFKKN
jgi:hypothetical protein